MDAERAAWAILASVDGLGPVGLVGLVAACGGAGAVLAVATGPDGERAVAGALGPRGAGGLAARVVRAARDRGTVLDAIVRAGVGIVTLDDGDYPARLRAIELPPPVLFVRGSAAALSTPATIAVVGTRRPTAAGRSAAARIAGAAARAGAMVVSGLAVGIDGEAHAAAVGVGGTTVAVIGGGHAVAIVPRHRGLAERIVACGGAVVSEHAPETAPTRGTFPRRNRVISGLATATVVVEAGERSGALITAGWALEQGRDCFVVPGPMDAPMSAGCLGLLRAYPGQVRVVAGVAALLEDVGLAPGAERPRAIGRGDRPGPSVGGAGAAAVLATLPGPVADVARAVSGGSRTVDHVVAATGLTVPGALAALTLLEDRGLVAAAYGRYRLSGELVDLS
jgi:DNA processing protein